jgi:16S rRNA (guanine527-N7)-methyltransferase
MDNFYERHVLHSLSIAKFISFQPGTKVLDFGTGGGFPGIPLAIIFPETQFHLVDSIGKKITVVNEVVNGLGLKNVIAEKHRVEELKSKYDFITCRAVTELSTIINWTKYLFANQFINKIPNGWLLLKGGDVNVEIKSAKVKAETIPLSDFYTEDFFREKYLLYIQS